MTNNTPTTPAERVASLKAEIANYPDNEARLLDAGDVDGLTRLAARMRVIERQLETAEAELAAATSAELHDETLRLDRLRTDAGNRAGEYEYAAAVYGQLAAECRRREAQVNLQLMRTLQRGHTIAGGAR